MLNIFAYRSVQWFILLLLTLLVYGHTLDVPFYFDDFSSIRDNPVLYQWQDIQSIWHYAPLRFISYLSFALNYAVHQYSLMGYHLVNISIHFLTGLMVYLLVRGLLKTTLLRQAHDVVYFEKMLTFLPFICALIFLLHPLQTQAVTYIVQRSAALGGGFYLASMTCFVYARLSYLKSRQLFYVLGCVIFALCAFFTKQHTFTLPLALLMIEGIFFTSHNSRYLATLLIGMVGLFCIWLGISWLLGIESFSLDTLEGMTRDTDLISRSQYFATQMQVLWHYIGLFFMPLGQRLDYDIPLVQGFSEVKLLTLGHIIILSIAIAGIRRVPLLAFAILFYYLSHFIESGIIPIRDVMVEHRTYLPNFGLSLLVSRIILHLILQTKVVSKQKSYLFLLVVGVVILSILTWQRNEDWRNPLAFWQENVALTPEKPRPWGMLGEQYLQQGKNNEAVEVLRKAVQLGERSYLQHGSFNTSGQSQFIHANLVIALQNIGQRKEALDAADRFLSSNIPMRGSTRSNVLVTKGNIYADWQQWHKAEQFYREGLQVYPENIVAMSNLGGILTLTGHLQEAEYWLKKVLRRNPDDKEANMIMDMLNKAKRQRR